MEKTLTEQFKEARSIQEKLYNSFVEKSGRLTVEPSKNSGLYIKENREDIHLPHKNISNITEEEAVFLIRKFKEFFGIE